ncbi:CAAX prenyl protease-like protein [Hephaestia caeni]|uniref:CAAX prenyl protease-like protein n=1 Tax=Hephaestia caeni TaxID=645617 RepID=A0A397NVZ4_9SPHN|nr:CPBP family intramembrane glutamic endopeptidase [Hephaestia caeni]RIA37561.1 CAAX prenyl protease-like protein [Hephaestia caeni]
MALIVLALALGAYVYFFKGNFGRLRELTAARPPGWRRRRYRLWIAKAFVLFAGPALLGLALLGRLDALAMLPEEFETLAVAAGYPLPIGWLVLEVLAGLLVGALLGGGWALWRRRRGKAPAMLGDFSLLLPRARGEMLHAAASALAAGITEELYFRLLLPLAIALVTGNALIGFVAATLLFGLAHRYQRWRGVLATSAVGAVLAFVYLASGALWLAILVHVLVDLNGVLLRPWLGGMLPRV